MYVHEVRQFVAFRFLGGREGRRILYAFLSLDKGSIRPTWVETMGAR